MRDLRRFALLVPLLLCACEADIPEGKLACSRDAECPGGWHCLAGDTGKRCYSSDEAPAGGSAGRKTTSTNGNYKPRIAIDSRGNGIALWSQYDNNYDSLWANRFE